MAAFATARKHVAKELGVGGDDEPEALLIPSSLRVATSPIISSFDCHAMAYEFCYETSIIRLYKSTREICTSLASAAVLDRTPQAL